MMRFPVRLAALAAAGLIAAPAGAAQISAVTSVKVVKPVSLTKRRDLDFGTLAFGGFTGTRTVSLSQAGALGCATDILCSGAPTTARFNVQGSNRLTILITVTGGTMSNGVDSIPFTPDAPPSITPPNSGFPGIDFDVGGSIVLDSALVGGTYSGTMTVTADYQ
ncbi:MAG: DUF4402 domain-containing protein [Pseudomonadota bacterium]|nr:DUF4402 domain-containing protein [Pseudomonadota bacterium]